MTISNLLPSRSTLFHITVVAVMLGAGAVRAAAQPVRVEPPSNNYTPIPGFLLTANSDPVAAARFFHSKGRGTVLIRDDQADLAFVVNSRRGRVGIFSASDFLPLDSGELEPVSGKGAKEEIVLKSVDQRPAFTYKSVVYRVADKPPLLGAKTAAEIVADDAHYSNAAKHYKPTPTYMAKLQAYPKKTTVKVFFGSWCQNCHKWLPNILRVEEALKGSAITFEYHGLPQGYADPIAEKLGVKSVPYGIVYQEGKEIGRISGPSLSLPDFQLVRQLGI